MTNSKPTTSNPSKITQIVAIFIIIILIIFNIAVAFMTNKEYAEVSTAVEEASLPIIVEEIPDTVFNNVPLLFTDIKYETAYSITFYTDIISDIENSYIQLNGAITSGLYTEYARDLMVKEAARLDAVKIKANLAISKLNSWETKYPYATKTLEFLTQRGFSKTVASAIIGNMMVETSGGTLALKPNLYDASGNYYGLCQWSLYYRPEVADMHFTDQLEYLLNDIAKEFKTFGHLYKSGFTFDSFLAMENPAEAALAFAKVYERCASFSYSKREEAAMLAYNYFNLDDV